MYELAIWNTLLTNLYLFNPKSCQMEICSFFYQVQAVKCAMFKACTGVFMLKCTAAAFLSCRSPHRVRVACMVKVLDTLFVQGLKSDIMSIEAQVLGSTPGNKEHLKNENRLELMSRIWYLHTQAKRCWREERVNNCGVKQMCLLASLSLLGFPDHLREKTRRVKLLAVNSSLFMGNKIIQISWKMRFNCN